MTARNDNRWLESHQTRVALSCASARRTRLVHMETFIFSAQDSLLKR